MMAAEVAVDQPMSLLGLRYQYEGVYPYNIVQDQPRSEAPWRREKWPGIHRLHMLEQWIPARLLFPTPRGLGMSKTCYSSVSTYLWPAFSSWHHSPACGHSPSCDGAEQKNKHNDTRSIQSDKVLFVSYMYT